MIWALYTAYNLIQGIKLTLQGINHQKPRVFSINVWLHNMHGRVGETHNRAGFKMEENMTLEGCTVVRLKRTVRACHSHLMCTVQQTGPHDQCKREHDRAKWKWPGNFIFLLFPGPFIHAFVPKTRSTLFFILKIKHKLWSKLVLKRD
jgi:hypothetical protein